MKYLKISLIACLIAIMLVPAAAACSQDVEPKITFDPDKNYAAFLVVDNDNGRGTVETYQARSVQESLEIGPVVYYERGTTDFDILFTELISSDQIKVIWIICYVTDVNNIQASMPKFDYKGSYRYVLLSDQGGTIKVSP